MVNQYVIDILVKRIREGGINPVTGLPITVDDIKIKEYKDAVAAILNAE